MPVPNDSHRIGLAARGCGACEASGPTLSRRHVLRASAAASVAGVLGGIGIALSCPALAQTRLSPDGALTKLMDGNQRFTARHLTSFAQDLAKLQKDTAEKQEPFASVLACADSRVPVELIFDQSIGQLFVARVAGNMASPEVIASLEYGAAHLGTRVIMVMGHGNCGAVKATIAGKAEPGQISTLFRYIRPAVDQAGPDVDATVKANAQIQAKTLAESSPVLAELIKKSALKVVASYYDLVTGRVTVLS